MALDVMTCQEYKPDRRLDSVSRFLELPGVRLKAACSPVHSPMEGKDDESTFVA